MRNVILLLLVVMATALKADEKGDIDRVRESIMPMLQGRAIDSIKPAAMPGMYEVVIGSDFVYVTADGRYAVIGDVFDLMTRANLTQNRREEAHVERVKLLKDAIDKLEKDAIVYSPQGTTKHSITVFTDIDCGYCRKLHSGMKEMNDLGIQVRYLAFPRAGVGSESYQKIVSVWCAKDQKKAMDQAKAGGEPKPAKCENTVAQQYALGEALGVQGTPAILLEDGRIIPGYVPPRRLAQILDDKTQVQ